MTAAKKVAAVPLIVVGGLGLIAAFVLAIGTALYYDWHFLKAMFDGDFMTAMFAIPIISMLAMGICSLLMLPFNGLIALGGWLWESGETRPSPDTDVLL